MRVVFFNRFFWPDNSATAQILTDLCRELGETSGELTVVTSRMSYSDPSTTWPASERFGSCRVRRLWSTRFGRGSILGRLADYLSIYFSFLFFMLRELRPGDVVVVKTDPPLLSILGAFAAGVRGVRLISWCQDVFPEVALAEMRLFPPVRWLFGLLKLARDGSLRCSDQVVVLGEDMRDFLRARDIPAGKLVVISNWSVHPERDGEDPTGLRREWGFDEGDFVVGYSGNLGRAHDWRTLLEAARLLADSPEIRFLVVGGGAGYGPLREAVEAAGLGERFSFLPYQPMDQLSTSLRVPDLHWLSLKEALTPFIFPSKFFGILEAGRPVIFVGDTTSEPARLIREWRTGQAVPTGDAAAFAGYVRRLAADPAVARACGRRARLLWESRCRKSIEIGRWKELLLRVGREGGGA